MAIHVSFSTDEVKDGELDALINFLHDLSYGRRKKAEPPEETDVREAVAAMLNADVLEPEVVEVSPATVGFDPSAHQAAISGQFKDLMETSVANVLNYAADAPTRDSKNLPWDERIHSGNRALNADGTWRRRRGVDEATVERVEAELLGVTVEEPVVVPPPPPVTVPQPPTVTVPVDPAVPAPPTITFASLIQRVTAAVSAGTLTMTAVSEICQKLGVEALPLVGGRPDLFPAVSAELTAVGA